MHFTRWLPTPKTSQIIDRCAGVHIAWCIRSIWEQCWARTKWWLWFVCQCRFKAITYKLSTYMYKKKQKQTWRLMTDQGNPITTHPHVHVNNKKTKYKSWALCSHQVRPAPHCVPSTDKYYIMTLLWLLISTKLSRTVSSESYVSLR
jgi:hypothetical protein